MNTAAGRTATTTGALVAACAACCVPLLVAPAAALFAASGLSLAFLGQVGVGMAIITGAAALTLWRRRRRAKSAGCNCASSGDKTSDIAISESNGPAATRCFPPG